MIVLDSDAHSTGTLGLINYGVATARRAWLTPEQVANTRPWKELPSFASAPQEGLEPLTQGAAPFVLRKRLRPRRPHELDRLERRARHDVEANAVALLDRGYGAAPAFATRARSGSRRRPRLPRPVARARRCPPRPRVDSASSQRRSSSTTPGGSRAAWAWCERRRADARSLGWSRARRPSQVPISAGDHPPASAKISGPSFALAGATAIVTAASAVASPAARSTVALRKSV